MLDFVNEYWKKNKQKEKTLIVLIDNHKSKCLYADKILGIHLKDGKLSGNMNVFKKPKLSAKSKKVSKKSKKSKKKKKKTSSYIKEKLDRLYTNSSQEEDKLIITQDQNNIQNEVENKNYYIEHKIFHYIYNNENIDYKK